MDLVKVYFMDAEHTSVEASVAVIVQVLVLSENIAEDGFSES